MESASQQSAKTVRRAQTLKKVSEFFRVRTPPKKRPMLTMTSPPAPERPTLVQRVCEVRRRLGKLSTAAGTRNDPKDDALDVAETPTTLDALELDCDLKCVDDGPRVLAVTNVVE